MSTSEALNLDQAVEVFMAPEESVEEVTETEEVEETEEATEEEATEEDDDSYEEEEESEDTDLEDDESDDEPDDVAPETYTVKVDGKEVEVTLENLMQSYSGQGKIQKGMQEAAETRKAAEQIKQQAEAMYQQMSQTLAQVQQHGVLQEPQPPSKELLQTDPIGYVEARADYEERMQQFQQQQYRIQQMAQMRQEEMAKLQREHLQQEAIKLKEVVPELSNPKTAAKFRNDLVEFGKQNGFSLEELNQVSDHRALKLLADAMRYNQLKAGRATAEQKVQKARPVIKAGAKKVSDPKRQAKRKQQAKFKSTGSINDALGLLFE